MYSRKPIEVGKRLVLGIGNTTGNREFAVCHRHSAKTKKHSAKALPSVTLGKQDTASTESTNSYLPSVFYRALGK